MKVRSIWGLRICIFGFVQKPPSPTPHPHLDLDYSAPASVAARDAAERHQSRSLAEAFDLACPRLGLGLLAPASLGGARESSRLGLVRIRSHPFYSVEFWRGECSSGVVPPHVEYVRTYVQACVFLELDECCCVARCGHGRLARARCDGFGVASYIAVSVWWGPVTYRKAGGYLDAM